jgi:hypothetical protein
MVTFWVLLPTIKSGRSSLLIFADSILNDLLPALKFAAGLKVPLPLLINTDTELLLSERLLATAKS